MKKIIVCICLVLFIGTAYTQDFNYYYNQTNGWTGEVSIKYLCIDDGAFAEITSDNALSDMMGKRARLQGYTSSSPVKKLSEREWWLVWSALGEYSVADEEIYGITIKKGRGELRMLAKIQNNGQSINWIAYELY
jgi:hypothetical protein